MDFDVEKWRVNGVIEVSFGVVVGKVRLCHFMNYTVNFEKNY